MLRRTFFAAFPAAAAMLARLTAGDGRRPHGVSTTRRDGAWSDPSVWNPYGVPSPGSRVVVKHRIVLAHDITIGTAAGRGDSNVRTG